MIQSLLDHYMEVHYIMVKNAKNNMPWTPEDRRSYEHFIDRLKKHDSQSNI